MLYAILAFFAGSLPFSIWIGKYSLGVDIRNFGDGNPGATNVLRAGNFLWFSLALALDIAKAALPVGLALQLYNFDNWQIALISIAPTFGHAYSPFLRFRGGKAIATVAGAWFALSLPTFAVAVALLIIWSLIVAPSGYAVLFTMFSLLIALIILGNEPILYAVWGLQAGVLSWKHRDDLRQPVRFFRMK